jgi:PmbA protein
LTAHAHELLALAREALEAFGEAEAEVVIRRTHRGFARFAMGELGQHMDLEESQVLVRVAGGTGHQQVAEASTNRLDRAAIVTALERAREASQAVPASEGFTGFTGETEPEGARPPRFAASTDQMDATARADRVGHVLTRIRGEGLIGAGALETRTTSLAVATTRKRFVSHDGTTAQFRVWALESPGAGGAAGYGGALHRDVDALDLDHETDKAIRICQMSRARGSLDEGVYDVVFEPAAVAELVEWLGTIAFTGLAMEQGTSALAGRIGEPITGRAITMIESPLDPGPLGLAAPFDREGVWRRPVPLIEAGVARGVLYDRTTASRAGTTSTGSAILPDGIADGSIAPAAVHMSEGDAASVEELISGVDRGLYVCRLHYVNGLLEPRRAVMTGLTRDGCFLVEHGKITRALGNMRFTDSFLEGLARADGMTRERVAVQGGFSDSAHVVPAIRIRAFRFNGGSQEPPSATP